MPRPPAAAAAKRPARDSARRTEDGGSALAARRKIPNTHVGDARIQQIMDRTEALINERPFSAITVDDIVTGIDLNRATFYFYFDSKYAVLERLLSRSTDITLDAVRPWTKGRAPADVPVRAALEAVRDQLTEAFTELVVLWERHGALLKVGVDSRGTTDGLREQFTETSRKYIDATVARIKRDTARGLTQPGVNPRNSAIALILMNDGILQHINDQGPYTLSPAQAVRTISEIWYRSIYLPV